MEDGRWKVHEAHISACRASRPDIIVIETVLGFPVETIARRYGYSEFRWAILDPRDFGLPIGRPRIYLVLTGERVKWRTDTSLADLLALLGCHVVMDSLRFFERPCPASLRKLSVSEEQRLGATIATARGSKAAVIDVSQSEKRPICSLLDGSLPTFRTTSTLWAPKMQEFISGLQMLRAMGFPVCRADANRCGVKEVCWEELAFTESELTALAGNGMHVRCVAAVLLVVALFTEKAS